MKLLWKRTRIIRGVLFWLIVIPFNIYVWFGDPPYSHLRESVDDQVLQELMPKGRLPRFYEYSREVKYYTLDPQKVPAPLAVGNDKTICWYDDEFPKLPWDHQDIYLFPRALEVEGNSCLAHEIGHHIDYQNDLVSSVQEFQRAVDETIYLWYNTPPGNCIWCLTGQLIGSFPGINGNDLIDGWGGYSELYASLFELIALEQIPPPLRRFYQEYIPSVLD